MQPGYLCNPPVFKPVNPGLCADKTPGFVGLISGVSTAQKSMQNRKQLKCGKKS